MSKLSNDIFRSETVNILLEGRLKLEYFLFLLVENGGTTT